MTMTTKELLALVGKWRYEAVKHPHSALHAYNNCADELAPIATALCAEVEALRKVVDSARALAAGASYALWQHNGGGSPMHNHWSGPLYEKMSACDHALAALTQEQVK